MIKCRVLEKGNCEITQEYKSSHQAVDLVAGGYKLDNIVAHSDGKIIQVINNVNINTSGESKYGSPYKDYSNGGNIVKIDHGNGFITRYLHLAYGSVKVKVGDLVKKGQIIGYMGNTGYSFGGHLHFEIWKNGKRINPTEYLNKDLYIDKLTKSTEELAKEVIEGKWGNGQERKDRLGSRYAEVQAKVNEMLAPKVKYLYNPNYKGNSIVDGLKGIGIDSSFGYRSKLAKINGISDYRGSAEQNTKMLNMLKKGILKSL